MVWFPESQGEISKGIYVRGLGPETKSTEKELMALGMCLPVLRCKDPKYYTVWYDPYGWVSKKRLQKPRKAFGEVGLMMYHGGWVGSGEQRWPA